MPPQDRYTAKNTFRVRYAETDAMGIVHHASYIVYFEEGRSHYARERGYAYSQIEKDGYFLAVTQVNVRYIKPAHYDREITIATWIEQMQSRGMTFSYEITDTERCDLLVTGQTKHICLDKSSKVTRVPNVWRAWAD